MYDEGPRERSSGDADGQTGNLVGVGGSGRSGIAVGAWGFYGFRLGAGAGRGKEAGVGEVEGGVKSPDTPVV